MSSNNFGRKPSCNHGCGYPCQQCLRITCPPGPIGQKGYTGATGAQGAPGPPGTGGARGYYAQYYDTTLQTGNSSGVPVKFNTLDFNNGIKIIDKTKIDFSGASLGVYNIQFSLEIYPDPNQSSTINIWLVRNDTLLPWTNKFYYANATNIFEVPSWNWFVEVIDLTDQYEIYWSTDNTLVTLSPDSTMIPPVPSSFLTVQQILYTQMGTTGTQGATGSPGPAGSTGAGGALGYWGSFYDTTNQVNVSVDTAIPIQINNTFGSNGITIQMIYL